MRATRRRCGLLWVLCLIAPCASAAQAPDGGNRSCSEDPPTVPEPGAILIFHHAYGDEQGGFVEPWAQLVDGELRPVDGSEILSVDTIVSMRDGSRHPLSETTVRYIRDTGACWWTARTPTTRIDDPAVFATTALPVSTDPTDAERADFAARETTCISPFSVDFLARNPKLADVCDKSRLFATSDLDSDSLLEYWYRLPDPNGMSWAIGEATEEPDGLRLLVKECGYFECAR